MFTENKGTQNFAYGKCFFRRDAKFCISTHNRRAKKYYFYFFAIQ